MRIPVITLPRVLHIGTLNPADFGRNSGSSSHEGRCLSVSLCPHAWEEIAEIGGGELHALTKEGGVFIDMLAVQEDPDLLASVLDWARANGLITDKKIWKAWVFDSEDDDWRSVLCDTLKEARLEVDEDERYDSPETQAEGPDGKPAIERLTIPRSTKALEKLTGMSRRFHKDATDSAIMAWAMSEAGALLGRAIDGVWWRETFDPDALSAPRGGIFPERTSGWSSSPLAWDEVNDDEEMKTMPRTKHVDPRHVPMPC